MSYFPQVAIVPQRAFPSASNHHLWKAGILLALVSWLYFSILSRLASQWCTDPDWSHGIFVPVFSIWVLWRGRSRLLSLRPQSSLSGLPILIFAMMVLAVGVLGAELFLSRVSLLFLIAGLIVLFLGWKWFRVVLFPWAFLIFMVPMPVILFNQITFPLQILASKVAASLLPLLGVPVLREGNVINLPAMTLEVAEACSGIRSLLSLVTLAIIYGFFAETRRPIRVMLALASIPIAVAANSLRIIGTGLLAEYWGPNKAQGFFHNFSGWLIFLISFTVLLQLHWILRRFVQSREANSHGF